MKALRIGITIGLRSPDESLWVNGIKQNALNPVSYTHLTLPTIYSV